MTASPSYNFKRTIVLLIFWMALGPSMPALGEEKKGIALQSVLGLPDWITLNAETRTRYETLHNQFRAGSSGDDQILSIRTLVQARFKLKENLSLTLEMQDARAHLADAGSLMSASIVNTAELLEAHLSWSTNNLLYQGSESTLRAGRLTLDIGNRRFIARNRFRNVIQGYTGIDWLWNSPENWSVRTLALLPVNREPTSPAQLLQNDASFDEESFDRILWGFFASLPRSFWRDPAELYVLTFNEDDSSTRNTRNRDIVTTGFRFYRKPATSQWDYEMESMLQLGTVRATNSPGDTRDLKHRAGFNHIETGYTFNHAWNPRLMMEYDFASGDNDPGDGTSERFERLFGPNVSEFGPTSIHAAFVRSNIHSPGARFLVNPTRKFKAYLSYRAYWLASKRDGWQGASGIRDATGASGNFLGHLIFLRAQWKWNANLSMEAGTTFRIDGEFQSKAPRSPAQGNTNFSYIQTTLMF